MIVAERAQAHDFYVAVRFDGEIGLHFEGDVDTRGILRIDADAVNATDFGSSGVANAGTGLDAAGKREISMIGVRGTAEGAADGEYGAD